MTAEGSALLMLGLWAIAGVPLLVSLAVWGARRFSSEALQIVTVTWTATKVGAMTIASLTLL